MTVKPWHLLNPNNYNDEKEMADIRYAICTDCTEFIPLTKQCRSCGCFMNLKVKLKEATCPHNRW
jgi:hypothetical protein